jgi:hypothetical protein
VVPAEERVCAHSGDLRLHVLTSLTSQMARRFGALRLRNLKQPANAPASTGQVRSHPGLPPPPSTLHPLIWLVSLRSVHQLLVTASAVTCSFILFHPDDGGDTFLRNVGSYVSHTSQSTRWLYSEAKCFLRNSGANLQVDVAPRGGAPGTEEEGIRKDRIAAACDVTEFAWLG